MPPSSQLSLGRVLLTGAAGGLGRELRPRLRKRSSLLRVSDVAPLEAAQAGEEVVQAALEDRAAVHALLEGMDCVVHLGGTRLLGLSMVTMDARQGADWTELIRCRRVVPVHYDDYTVFTSGLPDYEAEARDHGFTDKLRTVGRGTSMPFGDFARRTTEQR